jgi:hypothetical protein
MLLTCASRACAIVIAVLAFLVGLGPTARSEPPEIMSRAAWKAKPADVTLMKRQIPRSIVIHHTSVRQQRNIPLERKMQGLQSFSIKHGRVGSVFKPPWGDVP